MEFFDMIPVPKVGCVVLTEKKNEKQSRLEGTLCLSDHHLLLSFREEFRKDLWLLYRNIDVIEKKTNNQIPGGSIVLKCKDFRILQLDFISTDDLLNIATSLEKLSSLDQTLQYPFFFRPQMLNLDKNQSENGWTAFTPVSEWSRLLASHGDEWRISYLNRDYKRCKEDERLLNVVLGAGRRGYIIDTRSSNQAQSARARGGGTEIDSAYPQWRKVFKSVPRLSDLAESLSKLIEACNDISCSTSQWLSRLESSGWLSTVQSAMNAACVAAQCLHQELAAVLVHGGAGRDSTLVITSIAQIILNPDCRTIRGFEALVEREWLQAGHPFYTRTRHGAYYPTNSQHSPHAPTFLLFLDCLYQLHYQFQSSFEYTTDMLIELFKHAYFSGYGTFLGDCESDRVSLRLAERTTSIWTYINRSESLEKWMNPLYEPNLGIIWPSVAPISINLWKELYLSHTSASPWDGFITCVTQIKQNHLAVKKIANQLRIQVRRALDEIICDPNTSCQTENEQEQLSPCFAQLTVESQKT
ncbi:hypothetical protein G9C98_004110 [Cotesia typhae]|uniref:Myotubularin phosphatase domain-containing protein n=1 Tax=Cotesia typhae TaxID=2053667 RepID=A0A8J5R2M6_9HYME|nr:hypothetical protein G9C98_004110 [Cotesia typhae]